jgi:hypothetical protein
MKTTLTAKEKIAKTLLNRKVLATILIVAGLAITLFFGSRAAESYRRLQYIREQGLNQGTASVEAIRGWMTIRYISVAYAVPEEYIFAQLGIPYTRRNSHDTLGQLNRSYQLGRSTKGEYPAIVDNVAEAVLAYRANPVATGLRDIRPWMTIRYIANSTGVPEIYILEQVGLAEGNNYVVMPLDELASATHYPDGLRQLIEKIELALANYEEQ